MPSLFADGLGARLVMTEQGGTGRGAYYKRWDNVAEEQATQAAAEEEAEKSEASRRVPITQAALLLTLLHQASWEGGLDF